MAETPLRDTVPLEEVQLESDLTYEEKPIKILETEERVDRKSTRLNSSHITRSRMPSSA